MLMVGDVSKPVFHVHVSQHIDVILVWFEAEDYEGDRKHYSDVMMGAIASQITRLTIVYSAVCSGTDQRRRQTSASLAFVREIHR